MSSAPSPQDLQDLQWHTLGYHAVAQHLETDPEQGLTVAQVNQRQDRYGLNELTQQEGRSHWQVLLDQFTNAMLLLLIGVAAISAGLDLASGHFPQDAVAILAIVGLNALLGYLQESRAEAALAALKQLSPPQVRVRRQGQILEISARQLVPGDWVVLEAGAQVPADGRLWQSIDLQIREAALTGEAMAVLKQAAAQHDPDTPVGDRTNMAFMGTEVLQGRGELVVTEIGMGTQLGRVAQMLESVQTEATPLQRRMDQLSRVLVAGALGLVALVVIGGVIDAGGFGPLGELVQVSLSMAVAVVPEGLPAVVTVTLAIGTQRMAQRQALIRHLPAVETLGSVTTICSDKTGTLTENKMVVIAVETLKDHISVTGTGYVPEGEFFCQGQRISPTQIPDLEILLRAVVWCNDASLHQAETESRSPDRSSPPTTENKVWTVIGDPTEGALLTLAGKAGMFQEQITTRSVRKSEIPFSSERQRMSVIVTSSPDPGSPGIYTLYTKGSVERVLSSCDRALSGGQPQVLTSELRQQIRRTNDALAAQGMRVLGVAYRELQQVPAEPDLDAAETELIWVGLVGMRDAPRREAKQAVALCRQAGIRPIMITGDHHLTAAAIARELGIAAEGDEAMEGKALQNLEAEPLQAVVRTTSVYARVAPEHKLRIVRALQADHQFVAMTGDGVNDAPALKQADIGIAMGRTGTDVSKQASDMILLDDNFATLVSAIEQGRIVYSNVRRFIKYILGSNIGEVLTIGAAPLLALPAIPLTPLQILWMNLVTDGLPALALAMEPAEEGCMEQPPVDPQETIFARGLGAYMIRIGVIFALITIVMMTIMAPITPAWKTMVFTTLCIGQMGHALAARSDRKLIVEMNPGSNLYVYGAVALTIGLQLALVYVPWLRSFFGTDPLSGVELLICLGFSSLIMVWVEMEKVVIRWMVRQRQR